VQFSGYVWLVVLAVALWALGTSLNKRLPLPRDPVVLTCIQQVSCGLLCLLAVVPLQGMPAAAPSLTAWFGVGYLTVFGSVAMIAYTYLVQHEPNERAVSYAFVNPLGATLLGVAVAGEQAVPGLVPGIVLILAGLFLVFYGEKTLGLWRQSRVRGHE
jgi:drug/metabolite transporter (DMT)-like permease